MKVKINEETCVGCGVCVSTCPEVFEMGPDGKAKVKVEETSAECVKQAAESCPTQSIIIEE